VWCTALGLAILAASAAAAGPAGTTATGIVAVSAGSDHTCGLTKAGGVLCWGWNADGAIGDGTDAYTRVRPSPVVGLASGVRAISAGGSNSCALTHVGAVRCWGLNGSGQLGNGSSVESSNVPVQVTGLTKGARAITVGNVDACAITSTGGAVCWGANDSGQLGNGTTHDSSVPVNVVGLSSGVRAIGAGDSYACALTRAGIVRCWGSNTSSQLGNGTIGDHSRPMTVRNLRGVRSLSVGSEGSCALTTAGAVKCWGGERYGIEAPKDLARGVRSVAVGFEFQCAVKTPSRVECWGANSYGNLGDGSKVWRKRPVAVQALVGSIRSVGLGDDHSCAVTTRGWVECWGRNDFGELGDGTTDRSWTPMGVVGFGAGSLPPCRVPDLRGVPFLRARTEIAQHACQLGKVKFGGSSLRYGQVLAEKPRAGSRRPRGAMVNLTLSR